MPEDVKSRSLLVGSSERSRTLAGLIALWMTALSAVGLLFPRLIYPDPGLAQDFLANDLVNLLIGLPFIAASIWLLAQRKTTGVLLLPGALVYVIYNYLAYALGRSWDWFAALCLALAALCVFALIDYMRLVDHRAVKAILVGSVPVKVSGWVLVLFGAAFYALAASQIISGIQAGTIPPLGDKAVAVADLLVSSLWITGGILLLRHRPLGYSAGLGLLTAASSLFVGLVLYMLLNPLLTGMPLDSAGIITLLPMSLIALVPNYLFWKGAANGNIR
jgi:hypothetical protein